MKRREYVSDCWDLYLKGHENYEFVDVAVNDDTKLFIDPCLLRKSSSNICRRACAEMESFFDVFYQAYRDSDEILKARLLSHAREENATKLGYGDGFNGKGNTVGGLLVDFMPLEKLMLNIPNISEPEDLTVLLPGFAEDGLSDLLTNVIHEELSVFTFEQMTKYNIESNGTSVFYSWNGEKGIWEHVAKPAFFYNSKELLLVPKEIVRRNYLFSTSQFFRRIILEHLREEGQFMDEKGKYFPKTDVMQSLQNSAKDEHWIYNKTINYTSEHNGVLDEYHQKLSGFYTENNDQMNDDELDETVYLSEEAMTA